MSDWERFLNYGHLTGRFAQLYVGEGSCDRIKLM